MINRKGEKASSLGTGIVTALSFPSISSGSPHDTKEMDRRLTKERQVERSRRVEERVIESEKSSRNLESTGWISSRRDGSKETIKSYRSSSTVKQRELVSNVISSIRVD